VERRREVYKGNRRGVFGWGGLEERLALWWRPVLYCIGLIREILKI
jgi:hypothetical protein